ncbi:hypothetical protein K9M74_02500 [Candidatus Woesearchaeota archaeon]|nr:hypothetical protein [Candidatus Woesearchaeota archaeon]
MKSTTAQLSTIKQLFILLLVVLIVATAFGKLFSEARHQVDEEFNPDKFFESDAEGEEALASSIKNMLSTQQVQGTLDIQFDFFAATKKYSNTTKYPNGQLVLLTSISDANEFFTSQGTEIGLQFQSAPRGVVSYLTNKNGDILTKSLLTDYDTTSYLKFRKLCYLPAAVHAPLLHDISDIAAEYPDYPNDDITISTVAKNYEVSYVSFRQLLDEDKKDDESLHFTSQYSNSAKPQQKDITRKLAVPDDSIYTEGLLVWVYDNYVCVMVRAQKSGGSSGGLSLENISDTLQLKGGNRLISDDVVSELLTQGLVEKI